MPYPLTYPTNTRLTPSSIVFTAKSQATSFVSPYGGSQQVVRYSGQWWELDLQFPSLFQSDAQELTATLVGLNGMFGTLSYKLPSKFMQTGAGFNITPTGDGNSFTTSGIPQIGKFMYAGGRLIQFTSATTLFPRLPVTGGAIAANTTSGATFRLPSNDTQFSVDVMINYGISFGLREAI